MDFIVGMPRSGTAHIAYILSEAGNVASRHEYLVGRDGNQIVTIPTQYYEGKLDAAGARQLIASYRRHPPIDLDACWKLSWVLPPLFEEYPEAKLVHLVRDPRTNVAACYNLDYYGSIVSTIWRDNMPAIRRPDWERLSQLERNCAFWTETHRLVLEAARGRPYFLIRQEDLADQGAIARLFAFLDIPLPPAERLAKVLETHVDTLFEIKRRFAQRRQALQLDVLPRFEEWSSEQQATLREMCGDMANRFRYML